MKGIIYCWLLMFGGIAGTIAASGDMKAVWAGAALLGALLMPGVAIVLGMRRDRIGEERAWSR